MTHNSDAVKQADISVDADSMRETNNAAAEAANMTRYVQTAP